MLSFRVSFALDSPFNIQVVQIECADVAKISRHLPPWFPAACEGTKICAIVEYRQPTLPHIKGSEAGKVLALNARKQPELS